MTGNAGGFEPVDDVGGIPGGQFGLDEGAQHFLGGPALRFGGEQHLGGGAADRGEFEPPQPGIEISRELLEQTVEQRV